MGFLFRLFLTSSKKEIKQKLVELVKNDHCNHRKEYVNAQRQPHITDIEENNKILVKMYFKTYT